MLNDPIKNYEITYCTPDENHHLITHVEATSEDEARDEFNKDHSGALIHILSVYCED